MQEIPAFQGKRLAMSAVKALQEYNFPGNIRELKNIIERAAYRDITNEITPEDIGLLSKCETKAEGKNFEEKVDNFTKELITEAMEKSKHNQAQAARMLGLNYHQFRHYHKKFFRN